MVEKKVREIERHLEEVDRGRERDAKRRKPFWFLPFLMTAACRSVSPRKRMFQEEESA